MKRTTRLRCTCGHGYGTHRLAPFESTVIPADCQAMGCSCVRYERADAVGQSGMVIRTYVGPMGSGSTTLAPWCGICAGWHIPGAGPCTATWSAT